MPQIHQVSSVSLTTALLPLYLKQLGDLNWDTPDFIIEKHAAVIEGIPTSLVYSQVNLNTVHCSTFYHI